MSKHHLEKEDDDEDPLQRSIKRMRLEPANSLYQLNDSATSSQAAQAPQFNNFHSVSSHGQTNESSYEYQLFLMNQYLHTVHLEAVTRRNQKSAVVNSAEENNHDVNVSPARGAISSMDICDE